MACRLWIDLNHIVNIFTNHSSFKGNQVDSTTVQDPLGFLFMNKNKSQSDTDTGVKTKQKDEKQYHILIPGLDLSKLAVNKRNILTGLLVNLYQDITKDIENINYQNVIENIKILIDWLVNNEKA